MTPDTAPEEIARKFLHSLVQPLIPADPSGVAIRAHSDGEKLCLTLFCSPRNMPCIIGRDGRMIAALRQLLVVFGWGVDVPSQARGDFRTDPSPPQRVRDLVIGWLDARYGPEAYRLTGNEEDVRWEIFVHPDHYNESDFAALETWAYGAARAQGDVLKIRLKPGGVLANA